jgi:hypothetical protein
MFKSLKKGFELFRTHKRIIVIYYLANLIPGVVVTIPVWAALNKFAGNSLMGQKLAGPFDMDFLFEFLHYNKGIFSTMPVLVFVVFILYGFLSLFLSGGVFSAYHNPKAYQAGLFWQGAGKYFGRYVRLLVLGLPVYFLLFTFQFAESGLRKLLFGDDPYQYITYWGNWLRLGISFLGVIIIFLIFDYARIDAVLNDERRMLLSLWRGIKFTFGNFIRTFGLAVSILLVGILALLVYNLVADLFGAANSLVVVLLIITQQFYLVVKIGLKLTLYGSELSLYKDGLSTATSDENLEFNGLAMGDETP